MQLYVLDRAKNTLATTADFYNDTHIKTVSTGSSTFEFDIDKTDEAALYMNSGNYIVFNDDKGRSWSFSILSYEEHQTSKTIYCEDVGIELINKNMDIWETDQAYSFEYYFNLIAKDTPWKLGVNQLAGLSRKLTYTGRDTGLGRLLSVLTGFDKAECQFNIKVQQNRPVEFTVDVYKTIGTIQDNIQIVYGNELNDIKKTESRAEFVTAVQGVGGVITPPEGTEVDPNAPEVKVDFKDLEYKDENLETTKGDPFLRAVKANKLFNPGDQGYIESYYEYDTQSNTELLNRTITQLNTYSAPQYTYEADVQVIDPTLDIGDTVTIIDHDYNPALYLRARVATLEKSYSDPSKGSITFTNYELLNSSLAGKLRDLQSIINSMPSNSTIQIINSNLSLLAQAQKEAAEKLQVMMESADGKNSLYYNYRPANAKEGDTAFVKNPDSGNMEIWNYVGDKWTLTAGDATFDDVKKQIDKAQADAQTAITNANTAVSTANQAVSAAGFANNTADQAKTAAANAHDDAANALGQANTAIANAATAIEAATDAQTKTNSLVTKVDDISGTIKTLATTETVDQLAGTVATTQSLAQFAADGLKLKADTTTVDTLKGTVNGIKGELDVQADKIAATVTANDVTGMLNGYATQSWSQGILSAAKNEITASVQNMTSDMATQTWTQGKLDLTADGLTSQISSVQDGLDTKYTSLEQTLKGVQVTANNAVTQSQYTQLAGQVTSVVSTENGNSSQITQLSKDINLRVQNGDVINQINISHESILIAGQKVHITGQTTIDSGIITNAMIGNAVIEAAKIKDGAITNAKIANLDGGKITANSITADKLAVNAILVGLNGALGKVTIKPDLISVSQGTSAKATKLDMNGIHFTDANGNDIGFFHSDTMTSGAGGVTLSGNLLISQRLEVNQMYAANKSGKGAWVVRDTGVGIGIPGFGILNSSKNGGIFFSDDDGIWLGLHGSWRQIDNLKVG